MQQPRFTNNNNSSIPPPQHQNPHQNNHFNTNNNSNNNNGSSTSSSTLTSQYSSFTQFCRRATEALSQAESICSQFSLQTKRNLGGGVATTTTSSLTTKPEDLITKFDQAVQNCEAACTEAKKSPLFNNVLSFDALQSLSPVQRQRIESSKSEIQDMERQIRILTHRHSMNVQKWKQQNNNNNNNNNNNGFNHVGRVLESAKNGNSSYVESQVMQNLNTEEDYKKKERESIHRVTSGVRQMVSESNAVLGALRQQRARVQETDSRLSQVLSGAGVAQSVVKQLEKMTVVDKAIVFGGIGFLTMFMLYLWFFM